MSPLHWKVGSGIILLPKDLVSISEPLKPLLLLQFTQLVSLHCWASPLTNPAHFPVTLRCGLILPNPLMQGGLCVLSLHPQAKVLLQMKRPSTPSLTDHCHQDTLRPSDTSAAQIKCAMHLWTLWLELQCPLEASPSSEAVPLALVLTS